VCYQRDGLFEVLIVDIVEVLARVELILRWAA